MNVRIFGRGAYAISLVLVSALGCKDDPVVGADAAVPPVHPDAAPVAPDDASVAPDAEAPPPEVCPRPSGTLVMGDINGDGNLDIADPAALLDHVFRAGRPPVCEAAADANGDGRIEADDATRLSTRIVTGAQAQRTLSSRACADAPPWPAGRCAPLAWSIDAPARVSGARFSAAVAVRSSTLALSGWAMSVSTTGCTVAAATTDGTTSAEIWDDPPGLRHLGYAVARPVDGGAIAYVLMAHQDDVFLPARDETTLLHLELEGTPPASGCAACTIAIDGSLRWLGRTIDAVVVADGRAYAPASVSASVEVCAP